MKHNTIQSFFVTRISNFVIIFLLFLTCPYIRQSHAEQPPSSSNIASTVTTMWIDEEFSQLSSFITNLYNEHMYYVPAIVAASFYDYIYLGKLNDASNKLSSINTHLEINPELYSIEFKDLLDGLRVRLSKEVELHDKMGTTEAQLEANASPQAVKSVSGEMLLPSIYILQFSPEVSLSPQ